LGGDEFAVLLTDESQQLRPEQVARTIIEAVRQPLGVDGNQLVVGASIGIALAPADGNTADDLMKHADLALYKSKEGGRGTFRFFEAQMDEQAQQRRELEMDMRSGLANGEFELYFQPLFDLSKNAFCGFEALIRWNHPKRGMISPLDFIPVAEETGLIVPIGEWVIQEGCRHARHWPDNIRVGVNVSTVQFRSPGLVAIVMQALAASGLSPNRLEIEITESIFLDSTDAILKVLHGLRALGVRIALDDFGTGYSSLSYLRSFPFDKIKIDRSFIIELMQDKDAGAVVRAITDLAGALGMETTAEGVEEAGQLEALRTHGCTNVQGYLFSKPVTASEALVLISGEAGRAAA
jgi:predicted signal transduction protein with EAL and GGDEF domain